MIMKKSAFVILLSLIFVSSFFSVFPAFATDGENIEDSDTFFNCGVYDDYGLFSIDEIEELDELVRQTASEIDMYIAIYLSGTEMSDYETEVFSDETYEQFFGENTDGVFYYMDLSGKEPAYDYISTSGAAILTYTDEENDGSDNRIDKMLDEIFDYLPSSGEEIEAYDIRLGIEEICRQLKIYAEEGIKSGYYAFDPIDNTYIYEKDGEAVVSFSKPISVIFSFKRIFYSLVTGGIIAVIIFLIIKNKYKFKTSCDSEVYVSQERTRFITKEDRFIRQYTTRTKIETSSSSSGGGGGGGGGGSHGGGGGHR